MAEPEMTKILSAEELADRQIRATLERQTLLAKVRSEIEQENPTELNGIVTVSQVMRAQAGEQ